jgi:phenylalanyl-tRNA synthetase beta chain
MPTITVNRKVFENLVGKKLPLEKLKDRISMLGTDLEEINDKEIIVEIFPNRPDMLSDQGLARAFSSFIGAKKGLKKYKVKKSNEKVIIDKSVNSVRPYTACAIVKNLKFDDEKIREVVQIQEKLHVTYGRNRRKVAIGIYPCEKIKFPIHFKAEEPKKIKFRPLEFPSELTGDKLLQRHPAGREYGHLLEGMKKFPVFRDADNKVLSVPPIINSHETGKISENTRDIFIECSGFDFNVLKKCLNIIVTALSDIGGQINSMQLDYPNKKYITPDLKPSKMKIDSDYINKITGLNLDEKSIKKNLEKMGYDYKNKIAYIPSYRTDIMHQIDLAEDVAIAYGYENINEEIPQISTIASESKFHTFKNKIANVLVGLGFLETSTYSLSNNTVQNIMMGTNLQLIKVKNPSSKDYSMLRAWIIPSLVQTLSENKRYDYPQRLFEIGHVFKMSNKSETNVEENIRLAAVITEAKTDFTQIKQILDALFRAIDLRYSIKETEHESFITGRVARISVNNKEIAYIGELHPKVIESFGLKFPVSALELNLTELFNLL